MTARHLRLALATLLAAHIGFAGAAEPGAQCVADLEDIARHMPANDAGASA